MTSWIRVSAGKKPAAVAEKSFMFETADDGAPIATAFPAQTLGLLYAILFARKEGATLHVADRINAVRGNFPLFETPFKDIAGCRFTDSKVLGATTLGGGNRRFAEFVAGLNLSDVRQVAKQVLALRPKMVEEITAALESTRLLEYTRDGGASPQRSLSFSECAPDIMMAVSGRPVSIGPYVAALRAAAADEELEAPRVLVYAEDETALQQLVRAADPRWTLLAFPVAPAAPGPTALTARARREAFLRTVTQLAVLQSSLALVCERATSLGQFLLATAAAPDDGTLRLV